MVRRPIGLHLQRHRAQRRLEDHLPAQFLDGRVHKRLDLLLFDRHLQNPHRFPDHAVGGIRGLRDLLYHVDSLGDAAEGGVLAIELRLRGDAHEELRPITIRLTGNADRRHHAALVLKIAEFGRQPVEPAGAPQVAGRLRVLQQRIAALDHPVRHDAVEGAVVVVTLTGEFDELRHVFRRFVGREFESEGSEIGGDHRLQIGCRLGQAARSQGKGQSKKQTHRNDYGIPAGLPADGVRCTSWPARIELRKPVGRRSA